MGAIVLFDGVCNFCNSSVNFVIEHDREGYFKFAPLQSEEGRKLADSTGLISKTPGAGGDGSRPVDSMVLVENNKAFTRSTAALRIVRRLGFPWSLLYGFIVVPRAIRDYFYDLFAHYRYRLFGKKEECMLPTPEVRGRFLT